MELDLKKLFGISHDAVVGVTDGAVSYANPVAERIFDTLSIGIDADVIIPRRLLDCDDGVISSYRRAGVEYSVSVSCIEDMKIFLFAAETPIKDEINFVSERMRSILFGALANIGITIDRMNEILRAYPEIKIDPYMPILNHNYYVVKHTLGELNTAILLSEDNLPFHPMCYDLVKLCSDLVLTVSTMMDRDVKLEFVTNFESLMVYIDPSKVEHILLNVLTNSYAVVPDGGRIVLRLTLNGRHAMLSVTDNGGGIPEDIMKNIFTRYRERLDSHLIAEGGSGLGLTVARGLAELHGGAVMIENHMGRGATVYITLPYDPNILAVHSDDEEYVPTMDIILTSLSSLLTADKYTSPYIE